MTAPHVASGLVEGDLVADGSIAKARAVFLDRDGVINVNRPDYVKCWQEFQFLPGALDALRRLAQTSFLVFVVTNQSAVGRGLMSAETAEEIDHKMISEVTAAGGRIDAVYRCPHAPADLCSCRKPRPGLFLQAAEDWSVDLTRSYCVGDKLSDLLAGTEAGCAGILVLTGEGPRHARQCPRYYHVVPDLGAAVESLVSRVKQSSLPPQH